MPIPVKKLRVLPNPWACIDHMGRPCGTVPCDPVEHVTVDRRWVGATPRARLLNKQESYRVRGVEVVTRGADHDLVWEFATEPVELPNTAYYRERICQGDLIAVDQKTLTAAGGGKYDEHLALLESIKSKAIKNFDAVNGEGTFEGFRAEREAASAQPEAKATKPSKGTDK